MYAGSISAKKHKPSAGISGYLARPKLGALRNMYTNKSLFKPMSGYGFEKRKKLRDLDSGDQLDSGIIEVYGHNDEGFWYTSPEVTMDEAYSRKPAEPKMEFRRPDYADTAYREAVSRLRILLAESYTPIKRPIKELDSAGEETDNQSLTSGVSRTSRPSHLHYRYSPNISKRYYYTPLRSVPLINRVEVDKGGLTRSKWDNNRQQPTELMSFIDKQEEYIEQLEKESKFCRDELTTLLRKVKGVINENEDLHEKQKSSLLKSVFNRIETDETETETETENKKLAKSSKPYKRIALEGPTIVFESRISELEAQLTQTKIELRKTLDENDGYKRRMAEGSLLSDGVALDTHRKQVENLQRKNTLQDANNKLQTALVQLRDKENSSTDQVKRSLDAAEQAQYEKSAADHEIRRLKDELERQHGKLRDVISEQSRRVSDERVAVERRYSQQIEQLTTELGVQWEANSKLQLELDKQRRENADLRRELTQKAAHVDELKKEMQNKIANMQSDMGVSGAEKSALEHQISTLQLSNERTERQSKQEITRLQAEIQSLRQRLDRSDGDLIHSKRENIRLGEQIATLEKEININTALTEERRKPISSGEMVALPPPKEDRDKELSSMVKEMESKHAATVADLEGMIHSQNQLMEKLTGDCHTLTLKLEENSTQHKEEIRELQANLDYLSSKIAVTAIPQNQYQPKDEEYNMPSTQRTAPHVQQPIVNRNLSRTSSTASIKPTTPTPAIRKPSIQYSGNENQHYPTDSTNQQFTDNYNNQLNQQYVNDQQQYAADPNQYASDTTDYVADPNQYENYATQGYDQYSTDPQYGTDPNQYAYDPNIDYSQYPEQYITNPDAEGYPIETNESTPVYQQENPSNDTKIEEKQ